MERRDGGSPRDGEIETRRWSDRGRKRRDVTLLRIPSLDILMVKQRCMEYRSDFPVLHATVSLTDGCAKKTHSCTAPEVQPSQCRPAARQQPCHSHHSLHLPKLLHAQLQLHLASGKEPADVIYPVEGRDTRDGLQTIHDLMPGRSIKTILPAA